MRKDFHRRVDRLGEELARRGTHFRRSTLIEVIAAVLGYGSSNEALADVAEALPRAEPAPDLSTPEILVLRDPVAGRVFGVDPALVASCDRGRVVVSPYGNALVVEAVAPFVRPAASLGWSVVTDAPERVGPSFDELGLELRQAATLARIAARPTGLVVAFGAVGTGRSTVVEACLEWHADLFPGARAFSVETFVERRIRGVTQIGVDDASRRRDLDAGYRAAIRAVVGRRPDLVYLDEVRSSAVADVALAFARGHKVWATAHGGREGVIRRFAEMTRRDEVALRDVFSGSVATRLLPTVCASCSTPVSVPEVETRLGAFARALPSAWLVRARSRSIEGCPACLQARGTITGLPLGLSGRRVLVAEVIDHEVDRRADGAPATSAWHEHPDSLTQREHCWVRVLRGEVDLETASRVFDLGHPSVRVDRVEACLAA